MLPGRSDVGLALDRELGLELIEQMGDKITDHKELRSFSTRLWLLAQ